MKKLNCSCRECLAYLAKQCLEDPTWSVEEKTMTKLEQLEARAKTISDDEGDNLARIVAELVAELRASGAIEDEPDENRPPFKGERAPTAHGPNVDVRVDGGGYSIFIGGHQALFSFSHYEASQIAEGIRRALFDFSTKGDPT